MDPLARQSRAHRVLLSPKVLTQQFCRAVPVSDQNVRKRNYHRYLPLFRRLGSTKLILLDVPWPIEPAVASTALVME